MQTGGSLFGATSTKSNFFSYAMSNASFKETVPLFWPSSSINWTSFALICSLIGNSCFIIKHLLKSKKDWLYKPTHLLNKVLIYIL